MSSFSSCLRYGVELLQRVHGGLVRRDEDLLRVAHVLVGDVHYPPRHRGREEAHLPGLGDRVQDELDVVYESHVEHGVRLVEHDELDPAEVEAAALDVVHYPSRGAHHDVDAVVQRLEAGRLSTDLRRS